MLRKKLLAASLIFSMALPMSVYASETNETNETESEIESETESETLLNAEETASTEETTLYIEETENADEECDPEEFKAVEKSAEENCEASEIQLMSDDGNTAINLGVDVYSGDGTIDWAKVKAEGVSFAFIRVGYRGWGQSGRLCKDTSMATNIQNARANGIKVGAYFYSTAISVDEAKAEADFVLDLLDGIKLDYPVCFDYEGYELDYYRNYGVSAADKTSFAITFLDAIEAGGYDGLMYGSASHLRDSSVWNVSQLESRYDVWVAQYWLKNDEEYHSFSDALNCSGTSYTREYRFWQFSSEGQIDGISGNADVDIEYGSASDKSDSITTPKAQAVQNLKTTIKNGYITVTWDQTNSDQYTVLRTNNGDTIGKVAAVTTNSYKDTNVISGHKYTYEIVNSYNGTQKASEEISAGYYLDTPKITGTETSSGIKISWKSISGCTGYKVYRKEGSGKYHCIATITKNATTSYNDTSCSKNVSYTYTVRAYKGASLSALASAYSGKYTGTVPASTTTIYQTTTAVNYRTKAGFSGTVVGKLAKGTKVKVYNTAAVSSGGYSWVKVLINGKNYYMASEYLKKVTTSSAVTYVKYKTTANLNYRSTPGFSGTCYGKIPSGTTISVVASYSKNVSGYTWYKAVYNKKTCYVAAKYLQKVK